MSLTIEQSAEDFAPVFNPMDFIVSSDNLIGNTFFFYLVKVQDDNGDTISQHRYLPRPDNSLLKFDASRILEKYTSYDISGIQSGTTGFRRTSNVYKEYRLQFVEETGSVASAVTSGATTSTSYKYAFNGALDDVIDYDSDLWVISDSTLLPSLQQQRFLTDQRGANIRIKTTESFELGMMTTAGSGQGVKKIVVKTYDISNSLLGTYEITNAYASGVTTPDLFLSCLVGPVDLNSTTLSSGSQPIITSSVDKYTVYTQSNAGDITSETLTFKIDTSCNSGIRIHYLNRLGRIDSFTFNFANDSSLEVTKSAFRKLSGSFSGSTFARTRYESESTNFFTQVDKKIKVRTDYISDTEAEWLQYMVSSPIHWGIIDGELVNLVLDTKSYNVQTAEKNKIFFIECDFTFSKSIYRQRL